MLTKRQKISPKNITSNEFIQPVRYLTGEGATRKGLIKKIFLISSVMFLFYQCNNTINSLSENDKIELNKQLSMMEERDQKYRLMINGINESELDSLEEVLSKEEFMAIIQSKLKQKEQMPAHQLDSLMNLQASLDSINEIEFTKIVEKYGYPSFERTGSYFSMGFSLHLMGPVNFNKWKPILLRELKKGNISGSEYARWYDRNMLVMGEKQLYGEYNQITPCVLDLSNTNSEREKIGLKPLKINNCSTEALK